MRTKLLTLFAASALIGGASLLGGAVQPAGADWVPWVDLSPTEGPAGTTITATPNTWCATTTQEPGENIQPGIPGTVVVEFGKGHIPDLGSDDVTLDEVLDRVTIDVPEGGMWSATFTIPADAEVGEQFAVIGHCSVETGEETTTTSEATTSIAPAPAPTPRSARDLSFDYFPGFFEVTGEEGSTTAVSTTEPAAAEGAGATPATPVSGQADFTG